MVEVKFYVLVACVMNVKLWHKYKYTLLILWLGIALLNNQWLQNEYLTILLNTKYAGHFTLGIIGYLLYKGERSKGMIVGISCAIWMIYSNVIGYTNWIRNIWHELKYEDVDILLGVLLLLCISVVAVLTEDISSRLKKLIGILAPMSYTFYLLHADLGYFIRTQYYIRVAGRYAVMDKYITEKILMIIAIIVVCLFAYGANRLAKKLAGVVR